MNSAGELVTVDEENAEVLNNIFASVFNGNLSSHTLSGWKSGRGLRGLHKVPLSVSKVQVVTT